MKIKRRKSDLTPPYVPMADIAFNLVLFFLIMAKTKDDRHIVWTPAKAPATTAVANARVTVSVDKEARVYLNGEEIGVRDLSGRIATALGSNPPDQRKVLLKIHASTVAATFEPVMEAVGQAGGEIVHVLQEERPKP